MAEPLSSVDTQTLAGRTVGVTADRRSTEQIDLLARRGAAAVHGPTMETIDLVAEDELRAATADLIADPPGWLVVGTGFGVQQWFDAAAAWGRRDELIAALAGAGTRIVARGAKGASAIRRNGLEVAWRSESEAMPEVIAYMERELARASAAGEVVGRVALQLFDPDEHPTTAALRAVAGEEAFVEVPVYRWRLPEDLAPATRLIELLVAGGLDAVTFTSQPAVRFLMRIAEGIDAGEGVRAAFATGGPALAVCVGAVCSEAAFECGFERVVWPDPPRLVPMIRLVEHHLGPHPVV